MNSENTPLVSIITICYNLEDEISSTITSVLNLDSSNYEYILIDGASTDKTLNIIRSFENSFKEKGVAYKYISEPDKGIYDGINKGLLLAQGEWINILNGGDAYSRSFSLKEMFKVLKPGHIYFGRSVSFFNDLRKIRYKDFDLSRKDWFIDKMPNHQAIFIPGSFYDTNDYNTELNYYADTLLLRKAFSELPYVFYDGIVCDFEIGGVSSYYGSFKILRRTISDVWSLESNYSKAFIRSGIHVMKYLLQVIFGRERYLTFYMKYLLKE